LAPIVLDGLRKVYPGKPPVVALEALDLTIDDGELVAIVGPSGCGKSTVLRCVAGLEKLSAGRVIIGNREVQDLPPGKRDIAMVFQTYALYPHLTVYKNLAFPLRERHVPRQQLDAQVRRVAEMLELTPLLRRRPGQLSGGQRQRVAMGRAIIREPKAFLMDEPLSNLDAKLRVGMRASLAQLHARLAVTSIYVTHDQTEAMTLGHRVAVMRDGRVVQVDTPQRLYQAPRDLFVAAFIGSPSMNLIEATVDGDTIAFGQFRVPLDPARRPAPGIERVVLGVRPEAFNDAAFGQKRLPQIDVTVEVLEELGSDSHVFFRVAAPRVTIESRDAPDDETSILAEDDSLFTARVDPATTAEVGAPLALTVDPSSFHFFDVKTGESLLAGAQPTASLADAGR
jgi:multiple sugar transport system ATP-binding protein